jgi:hypothetical protein
LNPKKNFRTLTNTVKAVSVLERLTRDLRWETPDAINLMAREGSAKDLAACWALYRSFNLPYDEACWRVLPEMWRTSTWRMGMGLAVVGSGLKHVVIGKQLSSTFAISF